MSKQPDWLPEEPWVGKPKEEYDYVPIRRWGCGWIAVLALLGGIALGLAGAAALVMFEPRTVELILDLPILSGTERALLLTAQANESRATQSASDLLNTQNALATHEAVLNQAATRNAADLAATRTAIAIDNAQRATQSAFSLGSTQAAIYLYATQVRAESMQQQFQGELNQTATQLAINAAATQGQLAVEFNQTQAAQGQATSTPTPAG